MEKEFDHLRCPICGSELMYSEGTHDLCCRNNPYERMSRDHAVREAAASYGSEESGAGPRTGNESHIYKVWGKGEPVEDVTKKRTTGGGTHDEREDAVLFRSKEEGGTGTKECPVLISGRIRVMAKRSLACSR